MKKVLMVVLVLVGISVVVFADVDLQLSEKTGVGGSLQNIVNWVSGTLGIALLGIGIIMAGIKFSLHDPNALKSSWGPLVGGVLVLAAGQIINLMRTFIK